MGDGTRGPGRPPLVVGLLGGIASGKSEVARRLAARGAEVLDADRLAHAELDRPEVRERLRAEFGPGIFDAAGELDRRELSRVVFADPARLRRLEQIVHPGVLAAIAGRLAALAAPAPARRRVAVLDVPLLLESGMAAGCDELLFVHAPPAARRARARARGWDEAELGRREAHQADLERKRAAATWVVDNTGSLAELDEQLERFWRERIAPALRPAD
ncbi:MAG: dephospho-CoA kinase [Planctomycetota bacterium]|nr:MAG: dephospho-CoA kinase [Planctomycetota bacterium]